MELLKLVKIVPIIRKYIRVPDGTRINKKQQNSLNFKQKWQKLKKYLKKSLIL
jgi:hypothetical protein